MKQTPDIGMNRTGIESHPMQTRNMLDGMEEFPPTSVGNGQNIKMVRVEYAQESEGTGSIPPLGAQKADEALAMLVDKLGARAAFERAGVRLYDALISKYDAYGGFAGGPSKQELEQMRQQELDHFLLVNRAIEGLGGDPTAITPSANLQVTASQGIVAILTDPRTSLLDCLEVILIAELADHESWESLIQLSRNSGHDDMCKAFANALMIEEEHLENVRRWLAAGQGRASSH